MSTAILHYLYDPFCGWCYGAAPLISAAQDIQGLQIRPHGIGMLSGNASQMMSVNWADFVRSHEERISVYSDQAFGAPYARGALENAELLLDSSPPIATMLTAQKLAGRGMEMLTRLQTAYYQDGNAIADLQVIADVTAELGFNPLVFMAVFDEISGTSLGNHIEESRALMDKLRFSGIPAFALEIQGAFEKLPFGHYLGRPQQFKQAIECKLYRHCQSRSVRAS